MTQLRYFIIIAFIILAQNFIAVSAYAIPNAYTKQSYLPNYHDFDNEDYNQLSKNYESLESTEDASVNDPLDFINKPIFDFNRMLDEIIGEPLVNSYRTIIPEQGRNYINNFFKNTWMPITFMNDILQGDFKGANNSFWRFLINTLWGFGGIADFATDIGLDNHRRDFDQTFMRYKIPPGAYLVLPILGPTTVRGAFGKFADIALNPIDAKFGHKWREDTRILSLFNTRSERYELIQAVNRSIDPYVTARSLYTQSKINQLTEK